MSEEIALRETYYGTGVVRGDKTIVTCLIDPQFPHRERRPYFRLILDVKVPVEGSMVIWTLRYIERSVYESWPQDRRYPDGPPMKAIDITYDPSPHPPGEWRGRMQGEWSVKRVRIRRISRWQRLRRA